MRNQKVAHAIRSQGWATECAEEPLAGKFWTHAKVEHVQGPDFTSLYSANTGGRGSWVRGKRVWSGGRERGKPIMGFLLKLFYEKCFARMTYRPKEVRMI